jgi:hypothetical protein
MVCVSEGVIGWQAPTKKIDDQSSVNVRRIAERDEANRQVHRTAEDRQTLVSTVEVGIPGVLSQAQQKIQGIAKRSSGAVEKHVADYNQAQGLGPVFVQSGHDCRGP